MEKIGFVYTTFASHEQALDIVRELVEVGLAACGNIMSPHTAVYRWKGEIQQGGEVVVILKCNVKNIKQLIDKLDNMHPYELPCIVQIDAQSTPEFARWLEQ